RSHGWPAHRDQPGQAETTSGEVVLSSHHVADRVAGKVRPEAVLRRGGETATDGVDGDDQILRRVERLAGTDVDVHRGAPGAGAVRDDDRVGPGVVERAVRGVAHPHVGELLAALERELGDDVHDVLGRGGGRA